MSLTRDNQLVESLPPMAEAILKALAEYRYLTTNQFLDLGIAKDRGHLGTVLKGLLSVPNKDAPKERRPKEIGELDYGVKVGKGRLPRVYYLTKKGAEQLEFFEPMLAPIPYPPRVRKRDNDYEHQVRTIDFHIALNQWTKESRQELVWFRRYFDWWPASAQQRQQPVTRITLDHKNIVPDALFKLLGTDGKARYFAFEMANGRDTGRVIDQMREYCRGLEQGRINLALKYEKAVRIIYVFNDQRLCELVQSRALRDPWLEKYAPHFYLKTSDEISSHPFKEGWAQLDPAAETRRLF